MSCLYAAYGLTIESDLPIPSLEPLPPTSSVDLNIWQAAPPKWMGEWSAPAGPPWRVGVTRDETGEPVLRMWKFAHDRRTFIRILYKGGDEFLVDEEGRNIWVLTRELRSPEYNAVFLLGPLMTFTMRLRGVVCLHGSAAVVDAKAVAFVGPPGAGKSTMAAAFARAGYPVLADDNVALSSAGNVFLVPPTFPRVRLWPESAAGLFGPNLVLPFVAPDFPKHYLDLVREGHFQTAPAALDAIYSLTARSGNSGGLSVEKVSPRDGLLVAAANTFGSLVLEREQRAAEFRFLGDLTERVPVFRLTIADDLAKLDSVVDAVVRDVRSRAATAG